MKKGTLFFTSLLVLVFSHAAIGAVQVGPEKLSPQNAQCYQMLMRELQPKHIAWARQTAEGVRSGKINPSTLKQLAGSVTSTSGGQDVLALAVCLEVLQSNGTRKTKEIAAQKQKVQKLEKSGADAESLRKAKNELDELTRDDMTQLQRFMDQKNQLEQMISNTMSAGKDSMQAGIQALKAS